VASYWSTPDAPCPTTRRRQTAATSIVTVVPFAMITVSAAVGTSPSDHVEAWLQLPLATLMMLSIAKLAAMVWAAVTFVNV
jgi:hypothetical protein